MPAVELFANVATGTVTTGGTTAPAAGTQETWTVTTLLGAFPAASSSATPTTFFRVADPVVNTEIIAVVDISGPTWTVIRGYEGSTPSAHVGGFAVGQIASAAWHSRAEKKTNLGWFNVLDYLAVGDGTTDNQAAITAAIAAATAAGGGTVYAPTGTYLINSQVTVPTNITLRGEGNRSKILGRSGGSTSSWDMLHITGNDVTISDLVIDGNGHPDVRCISIGADNTTQYRNRLERLRITNASHNAVQSFNLTTLMDFTAVDVLIHDSKRGFVLEPKPGNGSEGIIISRCTFRAIAPEAAYHPALQLYGGLDVDTFKRVVVSNCVFEECTSNCIIFEPTGCTDITITGNTVGPGGSRGFTTGSCKRLAITGNAIKGQDFYAIELNGASEVIISGNVVDQCDAFVVSTSATVNADDVVISGNTITNNGYITPKNSIFLQYTCTNWLISGNMWRDAKRPSASAGIIRVGDGSSSVRNVTISGNSFIAADSASDVDFIKLRGGDYIRVTGNTAIIQRNVTTAQDGVAVITGSFNAAAPSGAQRVTIDGNVLWDTGSNSAAEFHGIDDGGAASYTSVGLSIRRNEIHGFSRGISLPNNTAGGSGQTYQGNDSGTVLGNTSADQINGAARVI